MLPKWDREKEKEDSGYFWNLIAFQSLFYFGKLRKQPVTFQTKTREQIIISSTTRSVTDGTIQYDECFLTETQADRLFNTLKTKIDWTQEKTNFGHLVPRLTAYFADAGVNYDYSGISHAALPWPDYLSEVRSRVESESDASFNSVLLNYYRDGNDSVGWHADDEPELGRNPIVASISLGAVRRFMLKHNKTGEKVNIDLAHGSLLVMGGTLQHFWKHTIPKTKLKVGERINLTFRNILEKA